MSETTVRTIELTLTLTPSSKQAVEELIRQIKNLEGITNVEGRYTYTEAPADYDYGNPNT